MKPVLILVGLILFEVVRSFSQPVLMAPKLLPPIPSHEARPEPVSEHFTLNTNLTLRNTAIVTMDYGCGASAFCDPTLANFVEGHCLECEKCYCDDICASYGDCCVDRLFDEDTDSPIAPSPSITCQPQHPERKQSNGPVLFMVTSCPLVTQTDNMTRTRCESPSSSNLRESTPVSVRTTQFTYRNAYCALCHSQTDFIAWRHNVSCSRSDILRTAKDKEDLWSLVMATSECKVRSSPPLGINTRKCVTRLQDKCNARTIGNAEDNVEQLCGMFNSPVLAVGVKYKNIFCYLCNGGKLSRRKICKKAGESDPIEPTYPLSVLIDFNPKPRLIADSPVLQQVDLPKCNYTELYDPLSERCREAQCSYGRISSGDTCELILDSSAGVGYSGSLALKFTEKLNWEEWNDLTKKFTRTELRGALKQFSPFMFTEMTTSIFGLLPILDSIFISDDQATGAKIDFKFVSISSGYIPQLEDALKRIHSLELKNYTVGEKRGTLSSFGLPCPSIISEVLNGSPRETSISNDLPFDECNLENTYCDFDSVIYEPVLRILNCPYLEYNLSEYNIKLNLKNSSMEIHNQTFYLEKSGFLSCGDSIKICSRGLSDITEMMKESPIDEEISVKQRGSVVSVSPALTIVSVVCIALSLLCLFLTFLVYCLLPQLRTLPGKNTMVLVLYLFCAQLFFQVGVNLTSKKNLCRGMGVVIHYLWIATFMSTGTCAFHMYSVFTNMSSRSFHNASVETKKLIRYLIISNVLAVLVVGVCIGYHAGTTGGRDIGYGGKICFLNDPTDIGIFFAGPLGIVLVFNIFCFIKVAVSIRNVPNMKSAKNQANKNHAKVYLRLSILLGFTWIFGFVAAALQVEVLWYIFVTLNGLEGVFIFIAYCLNRRIWTMMTTLCCWKTSDKYSGAHVNNPVASTDSSAL